VEIVDDQVILVATKEELEKLERTKIPEDLQIETKPIVAIIGAGAGKYFILRNQMTAIFRSVQVDLPVLICFVKMDFVVALF
jgi:hypothetical protein